ncbi:hypothetical protein [Nocardia sp. CC227C]|uniref:hypothetical protein n=1 Tax=Nocardia sp. CC227C TaxID=3044562 RepID=UPI00278C14DD|nr:hypothetical protein [Nocardia sp. CC227C]
MYATVLTFHILAGAAGLLLAPVLMWADAHRRRSGDIGVARASPVCTICSVSIRLCCADPRPAAGLGQPAYAWLPEMSG